MIPICILLKPNADQWDSHVFKEASSYKYDSCRLPIGFLWSAYMIHIPFLEDSYGVYIDCLLDA